MNTNTDPVRALIELRTGVEMDAAHDPMGAAKLEALDAAIAALASAPPSASAGVDAIAELKALRQAYVRLLESGRDRIRDLGGSCDPVDVMERNDIDLRRADAALRALAQQPAAPSGEAVAWAYPDELRAKGYDALHRLYGESGEPLIRRIPSGGVPIIAAPFQRDAAPQQPAGVDGMVMVQASDLKTLAEFADRGMRGNPAKLAALRAKAILAANRQEGE